MSVYFRYIITSLAKSGGSNQIHADVMPCLQRNTKFYDIAI